eukprot:Gb_22411 [translate_table: standard]
MVLCASGSAFAISSVGSNTSTPQTTNSFGVFPFTVASLLACFLLKDSSLPSSSNPSESHPLYKVECSPLLPFTFSVLRTVISGSLTSSSSLSHPNVWAKIQNEWRRVPAESVPSTPPPRPMPPTNSSTPRVSLDPVTWDPKRQLNLSLHFPGPEEVMLPQLSCPPPSRWPNILNKSINPPPTLENTPPTRRVPTLEQTLPPSRIMPFDPLSLNSSSICNYTDTNLTSVPPTEHPSSFSLLVTTPLKKTFLNNGSSPSLPCLEDPPITNPHSGNCSSPPCDSPSRVSSHECFPPIRDIPLSVCDSLLNTSSFECPIIGISLPFTDKTPAFDMPSSSANQQTWPKFDLVDLFTTNLPEDIKKIILEKTCYKHFMYYLSLFAKSCSQNEWCREFSWNLISFTPCLHITADPNNKVIILSLNLHQALGWFLIWLHQINIAPEWWKLPLTDASYYIFYIYAKTDAFQNYIWDDGG